jgi:hypothetical protein
MPSFGAAAVAPAVCYSGAGRRSPDLSQPNRKSPVLWIKDAKVDVAKVTRLTPYGHREVGS